MPPDIRTGWRHPKSFFKHMIKDLLPEELTHAPKKGFILPLSIWTRKELRPLIEQLLSPPYVSTQGIFSPKIISKIVNAHLSGQKDFTQQVWTLLMFQLWYERYCENRP
jgi:asparagine synthase (glutamine-hydrolysing)